MRTARLLVLLLALAAPAGAQTTQTPSTTPIKPPSGTLTPAPVPEVAPGIPSTTGPAIVPEQIAPPAATSGPANATPFSNTPSGLGGNQPGTSTVPNLSR